MLKKTYLRFRSWYVQHYLRPHCDHLGSHPTVMRPWYVSINGPNIRIGDAVTIVAERSSPTSIGVWGNDADSGCINIGKAVFIGPGVRLSACDEIRIGDSCLIANGVYVTDSDWHGLYDRVERPTTQTPVIIGSNVWLGDHCTVLKGVTIGDNSVVAAQAVVSKDVPPNTVVAGNPAVAVKQLDADAEWVTRADFFADPAALAEEYDKIDYMVLKENGWLNWLRTVVKPKIGD